MEELAATNLGRIGLQLRLRAADDPALQLAVNHLWKDFASKELRVVRVSPARTVVHLPALDLGGTLPADGALLKIFHPQRAWEGLRGLLRRSPALAEGERWGLLAHRLGIELPCHATQCTPALGLLLRPWWRGTPVAADLPQRAADLGRGLATLHRHRWDDRDLDARDLLWISGQPQLLIPVDLGQARIGVLPVAAEVATRDLSRLLHALPFEQALATVAPLRDAYCQASQEQLPSAADLLAVAMRLRRRRALRRSRRCLREVSDFAVGLGWAQRRSLPLARADAPPPSGLAVLHRGRRGRILHDGSGAEAVVWKEYRRQGVAGSARRLLGWTPARRAYQLLYLLELLQVPAACALGWRSCGASEWLLRSYVDGRVATRDDAPALLDWLLDVHRVGLGFRDLKPGNFVIDADGKAVLIDADGIRVEGPAPGRDLARLLAEFAEDDPRATALLDDAQELGGPLTRRQSRRAAALRRRLHQKLVDQGRTFEAPQ